MKKVYLLAALAVPLLIYAAYAAVVSNPLHVKPEDYLDRIKLPPGFEISLYAEVIKGPRSMALSPSGTLFVGTFTNRIGLAVGKVYAIRDNNGDYRADEVITIAKGLNYPNGVAFKDGHLYVAELDKILRFDNIEENLTNPPAPKVISNYPRDLQHGWKFIRFGPDGKLYVPVGAPCNVCQPDQDHAIITRLNPDGSGKEVFARGIRNSVGFDWHPVTKEIYFSDNGRDKWGDDRPPEEINHAPTAGLHFGYPYRYGKSLVDPTFKTAMQEKDFQPAAVELPAHNACLGMRFYTGDSFPEKYKSQLFVACHGSWNRSQPDGYRVSLIKFEENRAVGYEHFATGWLQGDEYWGRPVDIEILPDGSLLVSDDHADVIYRISYKKRIK